MAAAKRPSPELTNKVNVNPVGNRLQEATAEDYIETAEILNDHASKLDKLTGTTSGKPNFGSYTSLEELQAAYPTGTPNAYAIIDAGVGASPQIALWDSTDGIWVINSIAENVKFVTNVAALPAPGVENMIYVTVDNFKAYVWKNSQYNLIFAVKNTSDLINDGETLGGGDKFVLNSDFQELANRTTGITSGENELIEKGFDHKENFDWYVFAQKYRFNGVLYEAPEDLVTDTITLDPAPATENFRRFDVVVFNDDFTFSVVKGPEGLIAAIPKINIRTQIQLTVLLVEYGTTSPTYLTKQLMYDEGVGLPAEFAVTKTGASITLNSTQQSSSGTKSIKVANPTNADVLFLDKNATFNSLDVDTISFKVKNLTAGNWRFYLYSYNSIGGFYQGTATIKNGSYGYNSNNITDWQTIIVPISKILGSSEIHNTGFALTFINIAAATFFFDEFALNGNFTQAPDVPSTHTHAQLSVLEQITQALLNAWNAAVTKLSGIEANATADQTGAEIKALYEAEANTNAYTDAEKAKLGSIDATHYLPPLQTTVQLAALPQASLTDKARVYVEDELSDYFYDATAVSGSIAPNDQVGGLGFWRVVAVGGETAASIKTKYESNPDTNAFTNALLAKVNSITEIFTTLLKTNYDSAVSWIATNGANILNHIQSTHAPNNAQKNSDITKAEIEAKLIGEITSHTHPASGGTGATTYPHEQLILSSLWNVPHLLNNPNPLVKVWDINGNVIIPEDIIKVDSNNSQIKFPIAIKGYATLYGSAFTSSVISNDVDAQLFIDAVGTLNATNKAAVNTLVENLKAYNLWNKIICMNIKAGTTALDHKWNLKDPRDLDVAYRYTYTGTWVHSALGSKSDGVTAFANTYLNPSTLALTGDISMGVYVTETPINSGDRYFIGGHSGANNFFALQRSTSALTAIAYGPGSNIKPLATGFKGFIAISVIGITKTSYYKTKLLDNVSTTGIGVPNVPIYEGSLNLNGRYGSLEYTAGTSFITRGLTYSEMMDLNTSILKYETALGRN